MSTQRLSSKDSRPIPDPDDFTRFYWEGAAQGHLLVQNCRACHRLQYPPDVVCVHCQSADVEPVEVSGRGTLFSFARVERLFHSGFANSLPYVIALVELEEQAGLRLLTNIVDAAGVSLEVGMPVEVVFEDRGEVTVPQFRPAGVPA